MMQNIMKKHVEIRGNYMKNVILLLLALFLLLPACKKAARVEDEDAIKDAIERFDKALIETYRQLKVDPLFGVASDDEIGRNDSILFSFKKNKVLMESEIKDIRFLEFKRVSDTKMDVRAWEKWRWRHLDIKTKKEAKPWVEEEYKILYHMKKGKDKRWVVDSLKIE